MTALLNVRPVFLVGFARGGSNIVLNMLRSHPDLCTPGGELNQVFKGRPSESYPARASKLLRYLPIVLAERREIFYAGSWTDRRPFSSFSKKRIDRILYDGRFKALTPGQNLYRFEGVPYTREQVAEGRLFCKYLNGLIFLSRNLAEMYPGATFIGLVRNGLAVCEGHIRRHRYKASEIAKHYEAGCRRFIEDSERLDNFHLFRFEDVIAEPKECLMRMYMVAGLDPSVVRKVRLQFKPYITKEGTPSFAASGRLPKAHWYDLDEMHRHFDVNVNENQIARLDEESLRAIKKYCSPSLEYFDYI